MQGLTDETVGEKFSVLQLQDARDKTLKVIEEVAASIKAGMSEKDGAILLKEIQAKHGAPKSWHPPQIRFGENTLLAFNEKGQLNIRLKEDDIFFFDIGPLFADHEGDVGRPFVVGNDPEMKKCCADAEAIWFDVQAEWKKTSASGASLYDFAKESARKKGWVLTVKKANGHRISDFPHIARRRGSIEGLEVYPSPNRWILEIQIRHPTRAFGAFYEDLLN